MQDVISMRDFSKEELDAKRQAALEAKSIISWKSPVRTFKQRSNKFFTKVGVFALIAILASIAFQEFVLVGVIIALVFMVYVLATAIPDKIEHRINNFGIVSGGKVFLWEDLDSFWFDKRGDERILIVQTYLRFPSRLIILLSDVADRTILDILEKHIHYYHRPVHTLFDKWAQELQKRISFE
jgi:hypothetical protein